MDDLAARIRARIGADPTVSEIRMFGGLCFMLGGNMQLVVQRDGNLLARVGTEQESAALAHPGVHRMVMRGRAMPGFVTVDAGRLEGEALDAWIAMTAAYVERMPAKAKTPRRNRKSERSRAG